MTKLFADRMFVTINGFEVLHVKTAQIKRTRNLQRVDTMNRSKRSAGYKFGNMHIQVTMSLEIEDKKAQLDPALGDPTKDVNLVAVVGGERYIAKNLAESDMTLDGSVGEGGKSFTFEALDLTNENGTSVNFDISL